MAITAFTVAPGDDLFRIAARVYNDPMGFTLLLRANGLVDPFIHDDLVLIVPRYNQARANDGILASQ
jgi:hypothetical protein